MVMVIQYWIVEKKWIVSEFSKKWKNFGKEQRKSAPCGLQVGLLFDNETRQAVKLLQE